MDISGIALQGMHQADSNLNRAAAKIASFGTQALEAADVDTVDLGAEMVALISAKDAYSVDLKVLKTAEEIQAEVADLLDARPSGRR